MSYLYPITLQKWSNEKHPKILVQIYCNQLMLSTGNAIYSYGTFYAPFRITLKKIKHFIPNVHSFLMLGTGLGSALKILQEKYHCYPNSILVDNDKDIIEFSRTYMSLNSNQNVEWVYADAIHFMNQNQKKFDLICVDIFKELYLPVEYKQDSFFSLCQKSLNPKSFCIFNMILVNEQERDIIYEKLITHFKEIQLMKMKQNTFFICMN